MDDKYKIPYINACIRAFAKRFSLSVKNAFLYLYRFKAFIKKYRLPSASSVQAALKGLLEKISLPKSKECIKCMTVSLVCG